MSHAEQRYFGTWPHPVGQHAGVGKDSVGNEKAETQTLPCLAGHSETSPAWQWSLFSMGGGVGGALKTGKRMTRLFFGSVVNITVRRCRVAVAGLSYC